MKPHCAVSAVEMLIIIFLPRLEFLSRIRKSPQRTILAITRARFNSNLKRKLIFKLATGFGKCIELKNTAQGSTAKFL